MAQSAPPVLPVDERWSRKYAHTQRRLRERFAAPVIGALTCQDIKTEHTQQIVNAAPDDHVAALRVGRRHAKAVKLVLVGDQVAEGTVGTVHSRCLVS